MEPQDLSQKESRQALLESSEDRRPSQPIQAQVIVCSGDDKSQSDDDDDDDDFHDCRGDFPPTEGGPEGVRLRQAWLNSGIRTPLHDVDDPTAELDTNLEHDMSLVDEAEFACFPHLHPSFTSAKENAGLFVKKMWEATHFTYLPDWLQDNDFLHHGHRPPLPSVSACFKSIFRIHSETGNIWSHMLGCVAFIGVAGWFLTRPDAEIQVQEKVVFAFFFLGAILCLGFSSAFHTMHCHSQTVGRLFCKLDYCGISCMIVGSFVPWLFYSFYCDIISKVAYMCLIVVLGAGGVVVSMADKFGEPGYRSIRAGVFVGLGLSGVIPCVHYVIVEGWYSAFYESAIGYLILMAVLYIGGASLYAARVPERFFPGKCDLWFQSHQIFHLFVVAAAFVHYHGITEMAMYRLQAGACDQIKPLPIIMQ